MRAVVNLPLRSFLFYPCHAKVHEIAHGFDEQVWVIGNWQPQPSNLLHERGIRGGVGDEGGFAPSLPNNEAAIEAVLVAIERAGYRPGEDIVIALDPATDELHEDGSYSLKKEGSVLDTNDMIAFWWDWSRRFPICSIEDGLAQDDWQGWSSLTSRLGAQCQIVGDGLLVTNPQRIRKAIELRACNSSLIKLNQIGTLTETLEAVNLSHEADWNCVISHRSGETDDAFIADFAVATGAAQIKSGSPARGERTAKYNRLLEIEEELASKGSFIGRGAFTNPARPWSP
ncbi:MAG: hypothetical protein GEU75_10000 [Dehalococcoidia bacterium]|nr:hypothetical protein [Dehalococcoidia bacterium]